MLLTPCASVKMFSKVGTSLARLQTRGVSRQFSSSGGGLSSVQHVQKFYKKAEASVFEQPAGIAVPFEGKLWTVKLDGRILRTAEKHLYFVPNEVLARMVTLEFYQQHDYIISATLPLVSSSPNPQFGITKSAVDVYHSKILQENSVFRLCKFIKGDSACIRDPIPELFKRQEAQLGPMIKKFELKFGIAMRTTKSRAEREHRPK